MKKRTNIYILYFGMFDMVEDSLAFMPIEHIPGQHTVYVYMQEESRKKERYPTSSLSTLLMLLLLLLLLVILMPLCAAPYRSYHNANGTNGAEHHLVFSLFSFPVTVQRSSLYIHF